MKLKKWHENVCNHGNLTIKIIIIIFAVILCITIITLKIHMNEKKPIIAYDNLIEEIIPSNTDEGIYRDILNMKNNAQSPSAQEVAYLIQASCLKFDFDNDEKAKKIIEQGTMYLLNNTNIDSKKGETGYGLYSEWDAFDDGSINNVETSYAITTADVMKALVDVTKYNFIANEVKDEIYDTINNITMTWCKNYFTETKTEGGYFWYSNNPWDNIDSPNVSAALGSSICKAINLEDINLFTNDEKILINRTLNLVSQRLSLKAKMENGVPFWEYIDGQGKMNDLVHHCFTIEGTYILRSRFDFTWELGDEIKSLNEFFENDVIKSDIDSSDRVADLYDVGELLWYYGIIGEKEKANEVIDFIFDNQRDLASGKFEDVREVCFFLRGLAKYNYD